MKRNAVKQSELHKHIHTHLARTELHLRTHKRICSKHFNVTAHAHVYVGVSAVALIYICLMFHFPFLSLFPFIFNCWLVKLIKPNFIDIEDISSEMATTTTTTAQPDIQQAQRCAHAHMRAAHGNGQSDRNRQRKNNNKNVRARSQTNQSDQSVQSAKAQPKWNSAAMWRRQRLGGGAHKLSGETVVDSPLTYACDNHSCCCCCDYYCFVATVRTTALHIITIQLSAYRQLQAQQSQQRIWITHSLTRRSLTTRRRTHAHIADTSDIICRCSSLPFYLTPCCHVVFVVVGALNVTLSLLRRILLFSLFYVCIFYAHCGPETTSPMPRVGWWLFEDFFRWFFGIFICLPFDLFYFVNCMCMLRFFVSCNCVRLVTNVVRHGTLSCRGCMNELSYGALRHNFLHDSVIFFPWNTWIWLNAATSGSHISARALFQKQNIQTYLYDSLHAHIHKIVAWWSQSENVSTHGNTAGQSCLHTFTT